jgi:hypothetical protein
MSKETMQLLDFEPLFYILDNAGCKAMVVKKENKYEYSGVWIWKQNDKWAVWAANLGKSHLQEYVRNYEFTKQKDEAVNFCEQSNYRKPLSTEQMQYLNQNPDFHY